MDLAWGASLVKAEKFSGWGRGVGLAFMLMTGWREIGTSPSIFLFANFPKRIFKMIPKPCLSSSHLAGPGSL